MPSAATPLLSVEGMTTRFAAGNSFVTAVDDITFQLMPGEMLGIVGESGSGKTVTGLSILGLVDPPGEVSSGRVTFGGEDILSLPPRLLRSIRGKRIAMIFQDPMTSLNPYLSVGDQLAEMTRLHLGHTRSEARGAAIDMLKLVGIPDAETRIGAYPHQFSGGMRQRVMIAMALSCSPEILIADEPTTALDVSIQAEILDLIADLREKTGTSVILITHDLGVVAGTCDRVLVMYAGQIFELAETTKLFASSANPYTRALLRSIPDPTAPRGGELYQIKAHTDEVIGGCRFRRFCDRAEAVCATEPDLVEVAPGHFSRCHFANEIVANSYQLTAVS